MMKIVGWKKLAEAEGISVTTAWRRVKSGELPPPIRTSPGLREWDAGMLEKRRKKLVRDAEKAWNAKMEAAAK